MAGSLCKIGIILEISAIEAVKSKPEVCYFCGRQSFFCLAVFYQHNPILTFSCCDRCHSAIGAISTKLADKIKGEWVSLDGKVPAYFDGGQFERDLRSLAGFQILPLVEQEQPVKDKPERWEAEE